VDVIPSGGIGTVRLSGFVLITADGEFSRVLTKVGLCDPTVAPQDCIDEYAMVFTDAQIGSLSVLEGQHVAVTVDLTFRGPEVDDA
jgi:hypothetical protein